MFALSTKHLFKNLILSNNTKARFIERRIANIQRFSTQNTQQNNNDKSSTDSQEKEKDLKKPEITEEYEAKMLQELESMRKKLVNELVVRQQNKPKAEKTAKQHRDAILFEEILTKEAILPLYDCRSLIFTAQYLLNIFLTLFGFFCGYMFYHMKEDPTQKFIYTTPCILFALGRFKWYRNFQRFFVESVNYNTKDKTLIITKRRYWTGRRYTQTIQKHDLLFTDDESLNKRNINYIHMKTLDLYCIGYKYAWVNQELFAYLISQRIKSF